MLTTPKLGILSTFKMGFIVRLDHVIFLSCLRLTAIVFALIGNYNLPVSWHQPYRNPPQLCLVNHYHGISKIYEHFIYLQFRHSLLCAKEATSVLTTGAEVVTLPRCRCRCLARQE